MAKRTFGNAILPAVVIGALAYAAWHKLKHRRCPHCGVVLRVAEALAPAACPRCGTVVTVVEALLAAA